MRPLILSFLMQKTFSFYRGQHHRMQNNYNLCILLASLLVGACLYIPIDVYSYGFVDDFDISLHDTFPTGVTFSNNGAKMFIVGGSHNKVYEYTLSTPFNVTTSLLTASFYVGSKDIYPQGVTFSNNGKKMFVVGTENKKVYEYVLSESFNVTTSLFKESFYVGSQDKVPQDITFSSNGAKMFVVGFLTTKVYEYTLSTPFNVTTSTHTRSFSLPSQAGHSTGVAFSNNGEKMFLLGSTSVQVYEYTLSTPFNVATSLFTDSFYVGSEDTSPQGVTFSNNGAKMFIVGGSHNKVYEYILPASFVLPPPTISSITSNATSSGTLKVGDTILFTLTPGSAESGATINGMYNSRSLSWITSNNGATYTATYTVSEGEADQTTPLQITNVTITDNTSNTSSQKNGSDILQTIDANSPTIISITSIATSSGTLKVGDAISFTLTPGSTESGATVNGAYNSESLVWSTANSGSTYTATYTVSEGNADHTTPLQITNVTITDGSGNTSSQKNGSDILQTIDANSPTIIRITSIATSSGTLKVGDTISFTLIPGSTESDATVNGAYNSESLVWSTANSGSTYTATYTVSEGNADHTTPLQITNVTITDGAGNTSSQKNGSDILQTIDANSPTIISITSIATSSGTLKVGDAISFTLTPGSAESGTTVNGAYNSESLVWSTANSGSTYTATYTVSEGNADHTTPLQITNVTITDGAGNTSSQKNGTDILMTIDANSPQFSNAQTISISQIAITLDHNVTVSSAIPNDFTLGGVTGGSINSIVSVSNSIITLDITGATISDSDFVTITYARTSGSFDDVSGNPLLNFSENVTNNLDATPPTIISITSIATPSGTLKVGDAISFTLTLGSTESGATVNGAYNSESLVWSTANSGSTYTATYTVSEGNADHTTPLQITNVTITDGSGNTSLPFNGTDILQTIDANSPTIISITSIATPSGTLKVGDAISFTLTLGSTESGATVNGAYNSESLVWSTANSGSTYTATYTVSEGNADHTTPLQITNVTITDGSGNTSLPFNGTDILQTIDANSPTIISITSIATPSGTLKVGDAISFTLTLGSTESGATVNGAYNSESLVWSTANSGSTYTATYTVSEGNADHTTPLQITNVTITDGSGNTSLPFNGTDILQTIDANSPTIISITSIATPSGTLKVGDAISFTLTLGSTESGATVNGAYNSESLVWSTANSGSTYTATYTVSEGNADHTTPLQITNVTITDGAGNTSLPFNGTDILQTIDANSPTIISITSIATPSGTLKVGDAISFTLTLGSTESGATANGAYNSESLVWSTANSGSTYTATYTVSEGNADHTTPLQITNVTITDGSGNTSLPFNGTDILQTIDANSPTIISITSIATPSGTLKVGDAISFTLTLGSTESGATANGAYNSESLVWSTANSGSTYTATYTVSEGNADHTTPLQITNVTITDGSGNTSLPFNGTDILQTIDANSPTIISITSIATPSGTLKVGDAISFTLTLGSTESGATANGAYNSESLVWSTANSGSTYTATYTVSEGNADHTTPLQITNVTITDGAGNTSLPFNGTDILQTIDANSPTIISITSIATPSGTLKVGDAISFTLTLGSTESGATANGAYNSESLVWSTANSGSTYTATYTVSEGNADHTTPLQITNVTITDGAGNTSLPFNGTDILQTIDANSPTIISITSIATPSGTLKVGDAISFTLTLGSTESGATANGAYNSESLVWSTANSGSTYTATYTVSEGNADHTTPLQITNVTITDGAGNTSLPFNGTDILQTIDANSPKFSSAALDEGTGIFTLTFDETINVSTINFTGLSIREANATTGGVTMSFSELTTTTNDAIILFILTKANRQTVISLTTPQLDIDAGAVQDIEDNLIAATADNIITLSNTPLPTSCIIPDSGDWIITSECTLSADITAIANVIVQNNSVLVIPDGVTLDIDFTTFNLTVQSGGGVLIKSGGTIT